MGPEDIRNRSDIEVAVVLPCYNEALTIGQLVQDAKVTLPHARVVVFDNMSSDDTADVAQRAGAEVIRVERRGKGNVVRSMFAEVDADVYVMMDGDGTYDTAAAPKLIHALLSQRLDMVIGAREGVSEDAGRAGHALGNTIFNWIYRKMFGAGFKDIFSGYRVFSRRFAKSFPALSTGFEIETELSVHAQVMRMPVAEFTTAYGRRPEGSESKLSTYRDGLRILAIFLLLMKEVKPFAFFNYASAATAALGVFFAVPVLMQYFETGLVERLPTWVLAIALITISMVMFFCGIILDSVARGRLEHKRMVALAIPRFELGEALPAVTAPVAKQVDAV